MPNCKYCGDRVWRVDVDGHCEGCADVRLRREDTDIGCRFEADG